MLALLWVFGAIFGRIFRAVVRHNDDVHIVPHPVEVQHIFGKEPVGPSVEIHMNINETSDKDGWQHIDADAIDHAHIGDEGRVLQEQGSLCSGQDIAAALAELFGFHKGPLAGLVEAFG